MKSLVFHTTILLFALLIGLHSFSQENNWSQFRGKNCSGIASTNALPPVEFGEDQSLEWKISVPIGSSSPLIWEDRIYLTAYKEESLDLVTICFDRSTGNLLWENKIHPTKFETPHAIGNPASSTAAVDENGVYVYFASFGIKCFNHEGKIQWEYPMPVPDKVKYGHPSSPLVMDEKLILSLDYGNDDTRCLMAFDKRSGNLVWKSMIGENTPINHYGGAGYSTPVRYQDQIIIHRCGGIASYSLEDGSPIWWINILTNGVGTPVVRDDIVYVNAWSEFSEEERRGEFFKYDSFENLLTDYDKNADNVIELSEIPETMMVFSRPEMTEIENTQFSVRKIFNGIDSNKDGYVNGEEWGNVLNELNTYVQDLGIIALPTNKMGELAFDDILWMQSDKIPEVPSPLLYEDYIYFVKNGGWVSCVDAKSGEINYSEKLGAAGACIASPILANGYIYLSAYNGNITVLKSGKQPNVVTKTKLDGKITATPAIVENDLYVRTSDYLYAFETK